MFRIYGNIYMCNTFDADADVCKVFAKKTKARERNYIREIETKVKREDKQRLKIGEWVGWF